MIVSLPAGAKVEAHQPAPFDRATLHSLVVPTEKATVPVGVPDPGATAETVAVKITACPNIDGFTDEVTAVVVFALTTCGFPVSEPALPLKVPSPL